MTWSLSFSQEICNNAIDDDGDGLIDLNDTQDCNCSSSAELLGVIEDPSFEDNTCCPNNVPNELQCIESWVQGGIGTPDYYNQCNLPAILPTPLPDGDGVVGATAGYFGGVLLYVEYIATCLSQPIAPTTDLSLTLDIATVSTNDLFVVSNPVNVAPLNITVYGTTDCSFNLPTDGCPEPFGWINLGSVSYTPQQSWSELTIDLDVPVPINGIAIGSDCNLPVADYIIDFNIESGPYFFYDDITLQIENSTDPVEIQVEFNDCLDEATLIAIGNNLSSYQWYIDGVALLGETNQELVIDEAVSGNISVLTESTNGGCAITETQVEFPENQFDIIASVFEGCAPLSVEFEANGVPVGSVLDWSFGISAEENPLTYVFEEAGTFAISASYVDVNGCSFSAELPQPIEVFPSGEIIPGFEILSECEPFEISLSAGGTASNCVWSLAGNTISTECDFIYTSNSSGNLVFEVSTTSGSGCVAQGEVPVSIPDVQLTDIQIVGDLEFCESDSTVISAIPENENYTWSNGVTGSSTTIFQAGEYSVQLVEGQGCVSSQSFELTTREGPEVVEPFSVAACVGQELDLSGFSPGNTVTWEYPELERNSDFEDFITVVAENECGTTEGEVSLFLEDCSCTLYIPNAFTPNGDELNDVFRPTFKCELADYEMTIFNRWGNEVFQTSNPELGWNGRTAHKGFPARGQVYSYILRYRNALEPNSQLQEVLGSVTLVR